MTPAGQRIIRIECDVWHIDRMAGRSTLPQGIHRRSAVVLPRKGKTMPTAHGDDWRQDDPAVTALLALPEEFEVKGVAWRAEHADGAT
jgi:hypothetical protein